MELNNTKRDGLIVIIHQRDSHKSFLHYAFIIAGGNLQFYLLQIKYIPPQMMIKINRFDEDY